VPEARERQVRTRPTLHLLCHGISDVIFVCCDCYRRYPLILYVSSELIAAPWPGEREIFSFGNMASRSSARLENLPLTRNVVAKDKEDSRSHDPSKNKTSRMSVGDRMRAGMSDGNCQRDIQREVRALRVTAFRFVRKCRRSNVSMLIMIFRR
jgi:hypothetical protein